MNPGTVFCSMHLFLEGAERPWQSLTLPNAIRAGTHSMLVFTSVDNGLLFMVLSYSWVIALDGLNHNAGCFSQASTPLWDLKFTFNPPSLCDSHPYLSLPGNKTYL